MTLTIATSSQRRLPPDSRVRSSRSSSSPSAATALFDQHVTPNAILDLARRPSDDTVVSTDDMTPFFALVHVDPPVVKGSAANRTVLSNQRTITWSIRASLSHDPTAKPPDDCNTKEGVLNPVILLRRHQKEGRRAGPRGRPELSTSVLIQRSQTVFIPFVINDSNDIFLLRLGDPVATGKGDLLSRNPTIAEVSRGNGDAPVEGRAAQRRASTPSYAVRLRTSGIVRVRTAK